MGARTKLVVHLWVIASLGCGAAAPAARTWSPGACLEPIDARPFDERTLAPVSLLPFDFQTALAMEGDRFATSGWEGLDVYDATSGTRIAHRADDDTFRAWIDDDGDRPTLRAVEGAFVAFGRSSSIVVLDAATGAERFVTTACPSLADVASADGLLFFACRGEPWGTGAWVLVLDAATGAVRARADVPDPGAGPRRIHVANGLPIVSSWDEQVYGHDADGHELFRRPIDEMFDLASHGDTVIVAVHGDGLVELDRTTGAELRRWSPPEMPSAHDSSHFAHLHVVGDDAYVVSAGHLLGVDLADGRVVIDAPTTFTLGADVAVDDHFVYACSSTHALAIDRETGATAWRWSPGSCAARGVAGGRPVFELHRLVRGTVETRLVALTRHEHAAPVEHARIEGTVRLLGRPRAGIEVHLQPDPALETAAAEARAVTDSAGRFVLEVATRGSVVVVADRALLAGMMGTDALPDGAEAVVDLDGRCTYPLVLDIRPRPFEP